MGTFRNPSPPTTDPKMLGPVIERINTKNFKDRFFIKRLPKENLQKGQKARWGFFINKDSKNHPYEIKKDYDPEEDAFFVISLRKDGKCEVRVPPWAWDEVDSFCKSLSRTKNY